LQNRAAQCCCTKSILVGCKSNLNRQMSNQSKVRWTEVPRVCRSFKKAGLLAPEWLVRDGKCEMR
jgi:hypothetical protein